MSAVERPVEVELKYRVVDLAAAERYLVAEEIGSFTGTAAARSSQFEDRYVDTADGAMAKAGFAVRLRQSGRGTVVSVKSLTRTEGAGGSVRREELEGPADRTAGPLEWPASDARSLVLEHAGDAPLLELVTIRQLRRKRVVRDGDTRVELSLDEVDVVTRSRVIDRFVELEAELVKGAEERLSGLAEVFGADPALAPGEREQARRRDGGGPIGVRGPRDGRDGLAPRTDRRREGVARAKSRWPTSDGRAGGRPARRVPVMPTGDGPSSGRRAGRESHAEVTPSTSDVVSEAVDEAIPTDIHLVVGKTPGVTPDDHVAEAGRKVMRFHLARMLAREPGTRAGQDPEELHAMRVATRRQRAAWRVFGSSFRPGRTKRYRTGLREIASRLGAVRDLDVLIEAAEAYRAELPAAEQRAFEPLLADWREHRDDARVLLVRELDSDGYRRWVDDYRDFVRTEGAAVLPVGPTSRIASATPPRRASGPRTSRSAATSRSCAGPMSRRSTSSGSPASGCATRSSSCARRWATTPPTLIARVTALQDHLGLMNDADVAASMARTFLVEHAGDLSPRESAAIGRYLVSREREVARLRRTIGAPWRGVAGVTFRRTLGRVVAGL